jgi:hypothetical protein
MSDMLLTINGSNSEVSTEQAMRKALAESASVKFREIWLRAEGGPAICALINEKTGWLMYLREPGDAGFSSRNRSYSGRASAMIEYELSNGQRDEYPASWAVSLKVIEDAFVHFLAYQSRMSSIDWHDDGG